MIGDECICLLWVKHSDWCGLAGIVQAIVETFPKNCALMFPLPPLPLVALFSTNFRPQSSEDDDDDNDNDNNYGAGSSFRRFDSSLSTPARGDLSRTGRTGRPYMSTPLLHGVPSIYHPTPRSHPVALSVQLQTTMRNVAHSWVTTIWTWGRRPTTREMARRIQPVMRPYPTPPTPAHVSMREWCKHEVLRRRQIWAPWNNGLVGPALKRRPESGEDAAAQWLS